MVTNYESLIAAEATLAELSKPADPVEPSDPADSDNPPTGDDMPIALFAVVLMASGMAVLALKKKSYAE